MPGPEKSPLNVAKPQYVPLSENSLKAFDVSEGKGESGQ